MRLITVFASVGFVICAGVALAHPHNEASQMVYLTLDRDNVQLEFELSPGVAAANAMNVLLDPDGNGEIEDDDMTAFVTSLLPNFNLEIDGTKLDWQLVSFETPSLLELSTGYASISVTAQTDIVWSSGAHELVYDHNFSFAGSKASANLFLAKQTDDVFQNISIDRSNAELALSAQFET